MRIRFVAFSLLVGGCFSSNEGNGCNFTDDPINNGSFRVWCGDVPCGWELTQGSVERASTWSEYDLGMAMTGTPTVLRQTVVGTGTCYELSVLGDIDPKARVSVRLSNKERDYVYPLGSSTWEPIRTLIAVDDQSGITFSIEKLGSGRVVLSEARLRSGSGCGPSVLPAPIDAGPDSDPLTCEGDACADAASEADPSDAAPE